MKTPEQQKVEVINYLKQTSKHLFKRGDNLWRIKEDENGNFIEMTNEVPNKYGLVKIDWHVDNYGGNAKHIIKSYLFHHNHKSISVKMKLLKKLEIPVVTV